MIIFFESGRLGNQIFQYTFLRSLIEENEKLVLIGLNDIFEIFENIEAVNCKIKNKYIRYFLSKFIEPLFEFLANKKIISSYQQDEKSINGYIQKGNNYLYKKGLIKNIKFVYQGYFQSEAFFDKKIPQALKIKNVYTNKADELLFSIPDNSYKIFVHIRRGDYLDWSVFGMSPLLPMSYFDKQIQWFLNNKKNCFFIFLSDDSSFIKNNFSDINNKKFSINNSVGVDLAIMTLCDAGITSNSSLSWWGAYLMKNRDVVFIPKYWLGFKSNFWYPEGIKLSFAKSVKI